MVGALVLAAIVIAIIVYVSRRKRNAPPAVAKAPSKKPALRTAALPPVKPTKSSGERMRDESAWGCSKRVRLSVSLLVFGVGGRAQEERKTAFMSTMPCDL